MPFDCSLPGRQQLHSKHRLRGKGCTLNLSTSTWLALPILWKSRRVMRGSSQKAILGASSEVQDTHASQRVAVITGGTSRLGAATAVGLARSGKYDKVVIIGRDESKAKSIIEELQSTDVQAAFLKADLANLDEVRAVCASLKGIHLKCLVCAAGVTALSDMGQTPDGHEQHFGLNFLSRFLMANSLLEELSLAGTLNDPSRVLLVGSARHWGTPFLGFSNIGRPLPVALGPAFNLQDEDYNGWAAFGHAAFCNVLFTYELQHRLRSMGNYQVSVSCFDPGPMTTAWHLYRCEENRMLASDIPVWLREFSRYFTRVVYSPEDAANTAILLATTWAGTLPCKRPQVGNCAYWENCLPMPSKYPLPWSWGTSYDESIWKQLWDHAAKLTGLCNAELVQTKY